MRKRGQFFLIAAIIIITVLVSASTAYNTIKTDKEDSKLFSLPQEIGYESAKVIDYGVLNSIGEEQIIEKLKEISGNYSNIYQDSDIFILYGKAESLTFTKFTLLHYEEIDSGSVGISDGGGGTSQSIRLKKLEEKEISSTRTDVEVDLGNNAKVSFDLKKGRNFYAIIKTEKKDETTVFTN